MVDGLCAALQGLRQLERPKADAGHVCHELTQGDPNLYSAMCRPRRYDVGEDYRTGGLDSASCAGGCSSYVLDREPDIDRERCNDDP